MEVITTILPIFIIILFGWGARKRGLITQYFLDPANKLVYFLSIPALVFNSIASASFHEQFDSTILSTTLLAAAGIYLIAYGITHAFTIPPSRAGTFVQSSGHGNVGYIGLPIAFYYLGEAGLAKASIIMGFLMIVQNMMSVVALQVYAPSDARPPGLKSMATTLLHNPVIIGAMTGIAVSAFQIPVPHVVGRCLAILGGMAPPMALLLIGASLSMQKMREYFRPTLGVVLLKLLLLPAIGMLLFEMQGITAADYLPALILLCSPTATVVYVMSKEMGSDADFAVASISASTLFASASIILWLMFATHLNI